MLVRSFNTTRYTRPGATLFVALAWLTVLAAPVLGESGPRLTMGMRDASLNEVMEMLARQHRVNILLADDVDAEVSFSLYDVSLDDAVRSIASAAGYMVEKRKQTYFILPEDQAGKAPGSGFTVVKAIPVRYTDAAELETKLGDYLSDFGKITAVPDRKLLMVEDQPGYVYRIAQLLEELDRRPHQVLIEAKLLEVRLNDEESFGIDWAAFFSLGNGEASGGLQGVGSPGTSGTAGFFFDILDSDYEVAIRALERDGRVRNLASPKVVTLENKEAEVIIGDRQGYAVTTTINQVTSESIEFLESGVILRVTPNIDDSGQILLTIHPEVSNGTVDDRGIPSQTTTEVTTQLLVPSGKSIFIGGLMRGAITETEAGIPVLGKVPGLRWAFGSRSRTTQNTETVVVITPRLLDPVFDDINSQAIRDIESTEREMLDESAVIEGYIDDAFPLLPNRKPPARNDMTATPAGGPMQTDAEPSPASAEPVAAAEAEMLVAELAAVESPKLRPAEPAEPPALQPVAEPPSNRKLPAPEPDTATADGAASASDQAAEPAETPVEARTDAIEASADNAAAAEIQIGLTEEDAAPEAATVSPGPTDPKVLEPVAKVAVQPAETTPADPETPPGRYALNLHSDPAPIEFMPELGADEDARLLYVTETELDGDTWYRLRLGFFATEAEAQARLDDWLPDYPNAWLVRVGPRERAEAAEPQALASAAR